MSAPTATGPRSPLSITSGQTAFTDAQIKALHLAARWPIDPPEAALSLLFHAAVTSGLDPFREQIRLLHRREAVVTESGQTAIEQRWSVETSIHGFRILGHGAARDRGVLLETSEPLFYDDRARDWVQAWAYGTPPVAAKYTITAVHPDGRRETVVGVVHYDEFVKTTLGGDPSRGWAKMPRHMLAKCAEADAWRRLFPDELGWLQLADSADTANEPTRARSDGLGQHATPRNTLDALGAPRIASDTTVTATAATGDTPDSPRAAQAPAPTSTAESAPASTEEASVDATAATAAAARRASRTVTRRRAATTDPSPAQQFLDSAATALRRDSAGVLGWVAEQLGRQINGPSDLSADDLARLQSALPAPAPEPDADTKP
ncbi:recombinase RecT [Nocardia abscessus]|uniref:recombinase RecT n=1 Tax=Nocardia abscessus TaxID=120957 RepID=UPI0024570AB8|nr:recombinase RecT [Nocardia abscessus]